MLILLDLEQTLIEEWARHPVLLSRRITCVRHHLAANPDAEVGLMSWAVYRKADMDLFHSHMKPVLEEHLDRSFDERWCLSMEGWGQELTRATNKILPMDELFDLFGKDEVFLALARRHPEWVGRDVVLWDDAFEDLEMWVPGRNTHACIHNIIRATED